MKCLKYGEYVSDDYINTCEDDMFPNRCCMRSKCLENFSRIKTLSATIHDIECFIHKRFKNDSDWCSGNCYYFAVILKERFPKGDIYYSPVDNHFIFKYEMYYFDYTGRIYPKSIVHRWYDYIDIDRSNYFRVLKDCVL